MSTKHKRSILSIKDKQSIILRLDEQTVTNTEAVECFKKCLTWMERQNNVEAVQLMQLRRMMELATHTRCRSLKQVDLLKHFRQK